MIKIVTSPTGKGVILILSCTNDLYELSGNSREELKWSVLEQKLHFGRNCRVAFPISDDISASLI